MTCLSGVWLAAPILFPMGAGLALFRMREKAACRRWVTLLLAVELVLFAAVTRAVPGGGGGGAPFGGSPPVPGPNPRGIPGKKGKKISSAAYRLRPRHRLEGR